MISFSSIEHKAAYVLEKVASEAKGVAKALTAVSKDETAVETITADLLPQAVPYERLAFAAAATLGKAITDTATVADAAGNHTLTLTMADDLVKEIKAMYAGLKTAAPQYGVKL